MYEEKFEEIMNSLLTLVALIYLGLGGVQARAMTQHGSREARPARHQGVKKPSPLPAPKLNDPNTNDAVDPSSRGEAVVRAAILLDRINFSPGEIDESYTKNLGKAISAFQSENGLVPTGSMDPGTWSALNSAQLIPQGSPPPAITTYVIAMEDVGGKFRRLPRVTGSNAGQRLMLAEAKLPALNYESPLQLLGEKFHCSPQLLIALNPGKSFNKAGVQILVPNVLTPDPPVPASVIVDAATSSVRAVDASGKILAFYPATIGSQHDPLPLGNWTIRGISWYPKFKYNPKLFWDAANKKPRATLPPGPKSPVGVVWIELSIEHYGIHGTPEPSRIGLTYSHGCIRLTNWDAAELGKIVRVGTPAVLQ